MEYRSILDIEITDDATRPTPYLCPRVEYFLLSRIYSRLLFNLHLHSWNIIREFDINRTHMPIEVLQEYTHLTDKNERDDRTVLLFCFILSSC